VDIGRNGCARSVTLSANFRGNRKSRRPPTTVGVRKLVPGLSQGVVRALIQYRRVTDGRTDGRTHDDSIYRASIA